MQQVAPRTQRDLGNVVAPGCDPGQRPLGRNDEHPVTTPHDDLRSRLSALTLTDEHRLPRRLGGTRRPKGPVARARPRERIAAGVTSAEQSIASLSAAVPVVTYPEELPVSQRRDDIAAALQNSQVVVVAGETGSGKTTQLPKI